MYEEWVSWPDWLGYKAHYVKGNKLPFEDARREVRRLGLKSQKEWYEWSKSGERPSNIPAAPDQVYDEWVSTADWLGYEQKSGSKKKKKAPSAKKAAAKNNGKKRQREEEDEDQPVNEEIEECSICLDDMQDASDDIHALPCGHRFHAACLNEVVLKAAKGGAQSNRQGYLISCPLCRKRTRRRRDPSTL